MLTLSQRIKNTWQKPGIFFTFLWLVLTLTGCSSLTQRADLNLQQSQAELTHVPFYAQTEYQCGPAALATVFQYRGQSIQPTELVSRVYTPQKQGSIQIDMTAAVRQQGLVPYPLEPSMQALLTEVENGNPVLIMQNLSFSWWPIWHYAVVIGFDLTNREVILRSGETERLTTRLKAFEHSWKKANYWALVIVEPDQLPLTAQPQTWLKTAYDLEQTGQKSAALRAYQAGFKNWPQSVEIGMALGNLYYTKGNYQLSSQTFEQLSLTQAEYAMVWNNWAYALKELKCDYEASQAAQCAVLIEPDDKNIRATFDEMQTTKGPKTNCPFPKCPTRPGD